MGQQGFTAKEHEETFWADGNALGLDREGRYKGVYIFFYNSLNWTVYIGAFYPV